MECEKNAQLGGKEFNEMDQSVKLTSILWGNLFAKQTTYNPLEPRCSNV